MKKQPVQTKEPHLPSEKELIAELSKPVITMTIQFDFRIDQTAITVIGFPQTKVDFDALYSLVERARQEIQRQERKTIIEAVDKDGQINQGVTPPHEQKIT